MTRGIVVRDATNTPRTITSIQVRDGTNTPRDISEVWVRSSNNTPLLVFSTAPAFSASASPSSVGGAAGGTGSAQTGITTVTPSGGTPPYTYAWALDFATPELFALPFADSPTSAASSFTQTSMGPSDSVTAQFTCTVTDDDSNTATASVFANFFGT